MKRSATLTVVAAGSLLLLCQSCLPIRDIYQQWLAKTRTPGQQMVTSYEGTVKKRCCPPYRKDLVYVEEAGAIPQRLFPGEEVNHRIRYAFCPRVPSDVMQARLVRSVIFRGRQVFRDESKHTFCPGTWTVDAFIKVPGNAPPGAYTIRLEIYCDGRTIKRTSSFFVKEKI